MSSSNHEYIYIAGPMRGVPFFNYHAFADAARRLSAANTTIFNPAEAEAEICLASPTGHETVCDWSLRESLSIDLAWICKYATRVHMLPWWERSYGARAEHATAVALGLVVTYG